MVQSFISHPLATGRTPRRLHQEDEPLTVSSFPGEETNEMSLLGGGNISLVDLPDTPDNLDDNEKSLT